MEILKHINWIDIVLVILLFRGGYIAVIRGFHIEIFKFCGTVLAVFASLHYYSALSLFLQKKSFGVGQYTDLFNLAAFLSLAFGAYGVFVLLRVLFCRFIKIEAVPDLDKWGGFVFGIGKSFLFLSLLVFTLAVTNISYFKGSIKSSYLSGRIFMIAPKLYTWTWSNFGSKFISEGGVNASVFELQEGIFKEK